MLNKEDIDIILLQKVLTDICLSHYNSELQLLEESLIKTMHSCL